MSALLRSVLLLGIKDDDSRAYNPWWF